MDCVEAAAPANLFSVFDYYILLQPCAYRVYIKISWQRNRARRLNQHSNTEEGRNPKNCDANAKANEDKEFFFTS